MRLITIIIVGILFCLNSQAATIKDWTMLVYINGHNNLDQFGAFNINEMEKVGSTDKVNVVVQWASLQTPKTLRMLIKKDNDIAKVTSPVVETLMNVDMGDYKSLSDFIVWGAKKYPAKHYFVVVWDHGGGWHLQSALGNSTKINNGMGLNDISWDDNSGHFISTTDLGNAMYEASSQIGQKIDVYGSDACLMAMPEVSTEMRNAVNYFVGSEETEPGQGWPYTSLLTEMNKLTDATSEEVSKIIVTEYTKSYAAGGVHDPSPVTFSAFNLQEARGLELIGSMRNLAQAVFNLPKQDKTKVLTAIAGTQSFLYTDYGDLADFLTQIDSQNIQNADLQTAVADVRMSLSHMVIAYSATPEYAKARGLSVWLPGDVDTFNNYITKYNTLQFNNASGWGVALQSLFAK